MSERELRRKLTFYADGRTLVLVKRPNEKFEHKLMMALLWALYLPQYPDLRIDVPIGSRYRPDLVQLDLAGQPLFWGEAGQVGAEKLRTLCTRFRATHLVFARWAVNLQPYRSQIEHALRGAPRSAPTELIGFASDADRFVDANGVVSLAFEDVTCYRWEPE